MYKIVDMWLTPNYYSRPEYENNVKFIVIHWVGVAKGTINGVYNYFEDRKYGQNSYGSAHEMVSEDIVARFIPDNEMAYAVGSKKYTDYKYEIMGEEYPNCNTYNIEVAVEDNEGNMTKKTYSTLVERVAHLVKYYNLDISKVILHHDITGKICHKLFVDRPNLWEIFKFNVGEKMNEDVDKMGILITKQKFNFLGKDAEMDVLSLEDHVYLNAENLRFLGLDVRYDEKTKTVIVSL